MTPLTKKELEEIRERAKDKGNYLPKELAHVSFGSMDDLRSFAEIQEAVSCGKCKKAEDPMKRFVYGGSEGQEARNEVA